MKKKKKKLLLCILFIYNCSLFSQIIPAKQVKTDIDTVLKILSDIHPTFNDSPNKNEIINIRDTIHQPLSVHEFFKIFQPLIALDGHTTLQFNGIIYPEIEAPLFPFETIVFNDKIYVKNNLSNDPAIVKGAEITSINKQPASAIIDNMLRYIPGEKKEGKIRKLDHDGFANWYRLVYGNVESFDIVFQIGDMKKSTSVYGIGWKKFTREKKELLDFQLLDSNIGYLKVGKFIHPKKFIPFIDSAFFEMNRLQIKNVIIDKTEGGGFSVLADSLLSYITGQPYRELEKKQVRISRETKEYIIEMKNSGDTIGNYFVITKELTRPVKRKNRFIGSVYILTGPKAYSAATMFVAMAKCYAGVTIVGQETGQPLISNGDISRHTLSSTGLYLYTSHSIYYLPCAKNTEEGVKPDIEVRLTLDDLLDEHDKYLEFTLDLIKQRENE